ncbi:MAG: hypothetical protein EPN49_07730 [Rhodanobacter sp.]|nr:MAG: hypothetical protein EPN49_07730 [Rhodanobacter sp.]
MKQQLLEIMPQRAYLMLKYWDYRVTHGARFKELQRERVNTTEDGYSYKPFDDKKAIFVHIPKCAGIAINEAIFGNRAGGHTTLEEYLNIFEPRCIRNYFKFTVVRNPWDRLVSAYFFLKNGGIGEKDRAGFVREFGDGLDFRSFVKSWVNRSNIWKWHHFRPQYHYMLDKREKVQLDFVAFLENIDNDFSYITDQIGFVRTLTKSNKSKHFSYVDYYDEETMAIVAETYAEDIQMLGYNFDNSSLEAQLASRNRGKVYSLRP